VTSHVLVVGGTKGLGRIVVERFLDRGCRVTAVSRSNLPSEAARTGYDHIVADLQTLGDAAPVAARALEIAGPIRYLIFCQRYRGDGDPWIGELQVSLTATRLLVEAFADCFCGDGDKAIAVVSSVYATFVGSSQPVGYHVTKSGLNQLVRHYAWEMGRRGIRANAIMPLTYVKPSSRDYYASRPELLALYQRFVPLGRLGEAEDSANLIDFLCSDKAGFITGQCIFVDGGVSVIWPEELARSLANM
jgi:NAD(P)-dependent dehydrogenase (short-subunit alcohol dehydrogenase family)